ncbi:NRDE family protein [Haloarchaeobius sp. HRN-SO-5]|uniref:NRDE family protein n=1 Tax=Haloarchaeobius sp. HRN-SO-5 TaxID=3446118 RepID=UPI003EBE2F8B
MCTLTLAWRVFDEPVVVAANRDELLDRPSVPPGVVETDPRVVAPLDEEAGGTWVGYNEHGLFVGVTNRWVDADLAGERSRGLLVRDALRQERASDAAALVEESTAEYEYQGFNLVVADAEDAVLLEWDGELVRTAFDPGVHVVVNVGADDALELPGLRPDAEQRQVDAVAHVREALEPRDGETAREWRDRAATVLGDHEMGVCVHDPGGRFGTRSSSLIVLGDDPEYWFAPGPPCETPYEPVALEGQV